jgi:cytochrome c553
MRAVAIIAVAMMAAGVPPPVSGLTPQELAAGKKLYASKCVSCHKLYEPSRYDDEKWNYWMDKMRQKARLGDDQYVMLSKYLQALRPQPKAEPATGNVK